ncbi:hypothetical protein PAXRUDRAFT_532325 [Paxillus rubicundulus Ve08.2h10]|uniref:Uncharacterized protein n=1 Tax=Paxillus rubicundulus Ve08.2h10 TaxID=930991 RepID=A0A0D0E4P2_9AGAM|nr:hypothetical protein PAXRUDRAFT_532325 [Paxillus rubicundulus Ve08.2h10]
MIVDPNSNMVTYPDNPPAYEFVAAQGPSESAVPISSDKRQPKPLVQQGPSITPMMTIHGRPAPALILPQPTIYHYQSPITGAQLASLLPPDHPEMLCLQQGGHVAQTKFGILGILAAIVWFPLGIGLCLLDRQVKCRRCGVTIDEGICS